MKSLFATVFLSLWSFLAVAQSYSSMPDAQFLDQMTQHHRDGIEMMKMAEKKAVSPAVKKMTAKMEKEQKKEIGQMQKWRKELFASASPSEKMPEKMDMSSLEKASGKEFDKEYLQMMEKHHQDGIKMINDYEAQLKNPTVKKFAEQAEKNQSHEVKQMAQLQSDIEKK